MMKRIEWARAGALAALVLLGSLSSTHAQGRGSQPQGEGFRAEFLKRYEDSTAKLVRLAGTLPQDAFTWRPMVGTRSVSEVLVHVAASNYAVASLWGTPVPNTEDLPNYHNITDKAQVIEKLKKSIAHMQRAVRALPDADMEKAPGPGVPYPTIRAVLLNFLTHVGEHLGQTIAYARVNRVVPPWTEESAGQRSK